VEETQGLIHRIAKLG